MQNELIAQKYSSALFAVVRKRAEQLKDPQERDRWMKTVEAQVAELDSFLSGNPSFLSFLLAPQFLDSDKTALVKKVLADWLDPLLIDFILFLMEKHRIGYLHQIITHFLLLEADAKGHLEVDVTTAVELTNQERESLKSRLGVKTGKIIELRERIDPHILGGMILILRDRIIDGSVRHKLTVLKEELLKVAVA